MGLSIPVSVTPVSPVWCCEMETGNYYEDFCLIMPVSAVSVGTNTTTTQQQHNNNQAIFWRHQHRTHHSDIVLCSTACTVWGWPCLTSPRLSRKQSAAIKTKLCVNCAGGGIYQYWINVELPTVVKSCVDAGQTVVRVKCGPIITPLSAARAGRCWHYCIIVLQCSSPRSGWWCDDGGGARPPYSGVFVAGEQLPDVCLPSQ